jgi:DNA polymerase elongation subunit (family B)
MPQHKIGECYFYSQYTGKKTIVQLTDQDRRTLSFDIETTGLKPWKHRITAIGTEDIQTRRTKTYFDENEKELITEFLQDFKEREYNAKLGYNIDFDTRFIMARATIHNIQLHGFLETQRIDVMSIMQNTGHRYSTNSQPGKLEDWAEAVLNEEKLDNGSNAPEMFHNKQYEQLKKYAQHDAQITAELWRRLKEIKKNNWVVID